MASLVTPRRILTAYAVAGVLTGTAFAVWQIGGKVNRYRHADGSVDRSPSATVYRTDPRTGEYYHTTVHDGRPLNVAEKLGFGLVESYGIPLVAGAVALCWGYVHLKVREWMADPFGDANKLDYEEPPDGFCPHGMT
jgi:hypothetical protein